MFFAFVKNLVIIIIYVLYKIKHKLKHLSNFINKKKLTMSRVGGSKCNPVNACTANTVQSAGLTNDFASLIVN